MGSREMLEVPNPLKVVTIPLLLAILATSPAIAQSPTYGVGRTPTAEELRRMDISISPEGDELPPGRGTAKEGAQVYVQKACIGCHGATGIGGAADGRSCDGQCGVVEAKVVWRARFSVAVNLRVIVFRAWPETFPAWPETLNVRCR